MLDVSIKQLRAKYKTPEQLLAFMKNPSTVEHKTDGVKLTLIKVANEGTLDDWMVSYKGSLFYRGEFDYQDSLGTMVSMGNSQFNQVFKHLETLGKTNIDLNTEFFIEFLVKKTTVMSNYATTGQMILIGYGNASPVLRFGKVKTNADNLVTAGRERFARELKINLPPLLHDGEWFPTSKLLANCVDKGLKASFSKIETDLKAAEGNPELYYSLVAAKFLELESKFGGKEEGIVVQNSEGLFKVQQDYQLDKDARFGKKVLYMEDDPIKEQEYWDDVLDIAKKIAYSIKTQDIQKGLQEIAKEIRKLNTTGTHSKKNEATIRDDIQLNAKNFYLKSLKGNDGALVIGKFRVLTNGHVKMIERAIQESDEVVIGVVTGSRTKATNDIRLRMVRKTFPNLKVIDLVSGNLFTAFKKADININKIYAGSDRVQDYEKMLLKAPGIDVKEIERTGSDISATKVIANIADQRFFKANTPRQIHSMYDEILETYISEASR